MGSMFRSEEMNLCQLFLQSEAAYACVSELGELAMVQFRDLNPGVNAFQRKFVNEVRRCDEMERKLRYIEREMKKEEMVIPEYGDPPRAPIPKEMIDLEATFEKLESELREVNTNSEALKRNFQELTELKEVLKKTQIFFTEYGAEHHSIVVDAQQALVADEFTPTPSTIQLGFVAGVIPRERMASFERILWFACRGNVFLRTEDIVQPMEDPGSGDEINKCVFIIFYQGDQLKTRVRKICDGYRATLYPCPESAHERNEMLSGVSMRLEDLNHVLEQTKEHRIRMLKNANKEICNWILKVRKIKAIYHTLNMCNFDLSHNSLIAEGWCPVKYLDDISRALQHATEISGSTIPCILNRMPTEEEPPTFFHTNKFTAGFQAIVDAYGVANYREVNPALYTCATFPFLFGVMFGDAGHGTIMFLFGLWMVLFEKKLAAEKSDNEIWNTFFGGRYIIMMMGLFSIYTGLIYNDVFSKSLNIFGSAWYPNYSEPFLEGKLTWALDPNGTFRTDNPYQFGIDPVWQMSKNKITFTNSYKMKLAVILGVIHMLFGVALSLANHIHFRRWVDVFCEFIPQVLFLLSIFGYLVSLIFYKWITFDYSTAGSAPSLLIHLINMFMFKYPTEPQSQATFYPGQMYVQYGMFGLAIICVPWMLLIKPFIIRSVHNQKSKQYLHHDVSTDQLIDNEIMPDHDPPPGAPNGEHHVSKGSAIELGTVMPGTASVNSGFPGEVVTHGDLEVALEKGLVGAVEEEAEDEFDFSEVFIHQCIHTIEYCLGCISNTASYLRLWALSLAHAQLSEVLWSMVLHLALTMGGYVGAFAIFAIFTFWAVLTIAVLLIMEGLSAFLHALRLHWVEFQNKFYVGQGYTFAPFTFKSILDLSEDFK